LDKIKKHTQKYFRKYKKYVYKIKVSSIYKPFGNVNLLRSNYAATYREYRNLGNIF